MLEFVDAALKALPQGAMGADTAIEPHASEVPGTGCITLLPVTTEGGGEEDEESWVGGPARKLAGDIAG